MMDAATVFAFGREGENKFLHTAKVRLSMSDFADDYFQTLEKYKNLHSGDILSIPDHKLEDAVMSWIWNKFNEDWSNQFEIVSSLPEPCQAIYSCRTVTDEIDNGGFTQLFYNQTGQFSEMAADGFAALGCLSLSKIMKDAILLYQQKKHILDAYNDGTIEGFMASCDEELFAQLEEDFFAIRDSINSASYIRLHSQCFGD